MGLIEDTKPTPVFAVKWCNWAWDEVFPALLVRCYRLAGDREEDELIKRGLAPSREPSIVICELPNGGVRQLNEGDVYVMNESGRTVADFHLVRDSYFHQPA